MKREILKTGDGSTTIHLPDWDEQYHSKHGAIVEARHVFIKAGLLHFLETSTTANISILEIGFGTGLNALLTFLESKSMDVSIDYTAIEAFPIKTNEISLLNFPEILNTSETEFKKMHSTLWEEKFQMGDNFSLKKEQKMFAEINSVNTFNIIYFDAFGVRIQPELWTETIFQIMFEALKPGGVLVTYAAAGSVRRAMQAVGFKVERLAGPPGKREMLRCNKIVNQ